MEIYIDCSAVGGALPILPEDIQPQQQPQPPISETAGGQVQNIIFMPQPPSASSVDGDAFVECSPNDKMLAPGVEPPIEGNFWVWLVVN